MTTKRRSRSLVAKNGASLRRDDRVKDEAPGLGMIVGYASG
jgi:hypothetical protein